MAPLNQPSVSKKKSNHKRKSKASNSGSSASQQKALGQQKIKASIRQTRRLLAKDNLKADVRIQTERRLKALEKDLEQATLSHRERTLAMRYHKVKFFERQKVLRKIKQTKVALGALRRSEEGNSGLNSEIHHSKKKQKMKQKKEEEVERRLWELRIDLNYILHYPKDKKYISMFPSSSNIQGNDNDDGESKMSEDEDEDEGGQANPTLNSNSELERETIRSHIESCMMSGQLSREPEVGLISSLVDDMQEDGGGGGGPKRPSSRNVTALAVVGQRDARPGTQIKNTHKEKGKGRIEVTEEESDDFFGEDE